MALRLNGQAGKPKSGRNRKTPAGGGCAWWWKRVALQGACYVYFFHRISGESVFAHTNGSSRGTCGLVILRTPGGHIGENASTHAIAAKYYSRAPPSVIPNGIENSNDGMALHMRQLLIIKCSTPNAFSQCMTRSYFWMAALVGVTSK